MEFYTNFSGSKTIALKPSKSNPEVLNYATKHAFLEQHSALTYWDDDYPSRIDLGKDKYGGPFSFEEVEDVKTVLRLIPVAICTMGFEMEMWKGEFFHVFKIHCTCYNASKVDVIITHFHFNSFERVEMKMC